MAITKADLAQFKKLTAKAKHIGSRIAAHRDELREVIADMEEIASNADEAADEIAFGVRSLDDAADKLSQQL